MPSRVIPVSFNRRKYGRHLLADVGWIHDLTGFLIGVPHTLTFFDITLVTRGSGWFWLDGERIKVRPGSIVFSRPTQVRLWDTRQLDGICLFFEELFLSEFLRDDAFMSRLPYFQAPTGGASLSLDSRTAGRMRKRLSAMRDELARYRRDSETLLRAQLHETLLVLARLYFDRHPTVSPRPVHRVVMRYLELIERKAATHHTVAEYADLLAVTPGYLRTLCLQHTGRGAKPLLDRELLRRATRLLLYSNESVARIGTSLGFADASYFSRFFRRECGVTPTELRRSHELHA